MGKRVHEIAKELGRENKEIMETLSEIGVHVTSHMSNVEDENYEKIKRKFVKKTMTKEPENINEKKTEGTGEEVKPKKKNIIQVFRPQNSKTGMVRPGQRPGRQRPAGNGTRPTGSKPQSNPVSGTAGSKPQGMPAAGRSASASSEGKTASMAAQEVKTAASPVSGSKPQTAAEHTGTGTAKAVSEAGASVSRNAGETGKVQTVKAQENTPRQSTPTAGNARPQNSENRSQGRGGQNDSRGGRTQGDRFQNNRNQHNDRNGQSRGQGFSGNRQSEGRDNRSSGGRYEGNREGGRFQGQRNDRSSGGGRMPSIPKAPMETKPLEKEGRVRNERGTRNDRRNEKQGKGDKLDRMEQRGSYQNQKNNGRNKTQSKPAKPQQKPAEKEETIKNIIIPESLTIKELADKMKVQPAAIVKKLFLQGTMVTVNQEIDFDTAEEIALEFNCICEKEEKVDVLEELLKEEEDAPETLVSRPPVVCVMGHVDHGKTSLLDAIRNTHVIDREAGGITQHIGASVVTCNGEKITFLDTPGHEAFTAMRMRGANSTDIAILVVAADDGVMPQTVEAINHAKAAGIEIIVAINKIDKPSANVERVKQELTEYELIPEDWGGSTIFVPVSAHTHEGIDTLLEMVLLTAEVLELKANPKRRARGLVIEAQLDKGRGSVATVLVQKGVLHVGDPICAGPCYGRIRAMMDDKGRKVKEAGPSTPVEILGFSDVPGAGEIFLSPETEKEARSFAETFISEGRERLLEDTKAKMSLDDLFSQIQAGNLKELNLIVKADVQGSVEAVKQSLLKLSNEEVVVKIIHGGVGAINESDVILASASNAIIIGFNVRPDAMAKATADREGVDVRLYRVIYDAIADVEAAMKGMLDPIFEEKVIGHAEVRQTFKASGVGTIAGSYVLDGVFQRGCSVRITREGEKIFEGALASLKRFKDDVKEVKAGYECGLVFEKFNDVKEEDQIEAYIMVEVPR